MSAIQEILEDVGRRKQKVGVEISSGPVSVLPAIFLIRRGEEKEHLLE